MENSEYPISIELMNSMMLAYRKISDNYLKNISGYHHDVRDIGLTYSNLYSKALVQPSELFKIYSFSLDYLNDFQDLYKSLFFNYQNLEAKLIIEPQKGDKRFLDPDWNARPYFNFIKQNYLLVSKLLQKTVGEIEIDEKLRKKLDFYTMQYISAFSPSNYVFTNPEVLKLAINTNGKSLFDGLKNLINDLENGKITQIDEAAYKVGVDLAITMGDVIYENDLMQLIQYVPSTNTVYELPLIIVPPWINKYYILDLQQKNSFVKFLVDQGITVFMISWRNPNPKMASLSFDDYVESVSLKAIEVVANIFESKKINMLGYCLGGTLLTITSSILSENKKSNPINSATFLASMVDFTDIGPMGDVIDGALIKKLERGELLHHGLLNGRDMETAFNLIRPNDLVWNYVIHNYLKGLKPRTFDVIYWTNDNTNLPGKMYVYYMKKMIFENKLSRPNGLHIFNTAIDVGRINFPVFVIGLKDDNISPAITAFATTELVNGPVEFILGESGHVMGVVNPPYKNKYGYYLNGELGNGFENWKNTASHFTGSWWPVWVDKLKKVSGSKLESSIFVGNKKHKVIESAPGRYVKEKC